MKCPNCGLNMPDGSLVCPSCHYQIGLTQKLPVFKGTYCAICGALVPAGATACPKCSTPLPGAGDPKPEPVQRSMRELDLPEIAEDPMDEFDSSSASDLLRALGNSREARIESAIPAEGDPSSAVARHDRMPRSRVFLVAALAAVLVVGGATLAITHPWSPTVTVSHTTVGIDTSQAGSPGVVDALTGQDTSVTSGSDTTTSSLYDAILADYTTLGDLADQIDACYDEFDSAAFSADQSTVDDASDRATSVSLQVSNLISDIALLDDNSGTYADDLSNLTTLGNWLRNRVDALTDAWDAVDASDDPSSERDAIDDVLKRNYGGGTDVYRAYFEESYEGWEPVQK